MEANFIKCESNQHSEECIMAVRMCTKCNKFLCTDCVVDYHVDHIQDAKLKIVDLLINEKQAFEKVLTKIIDTECSRSIDPDKIVNYKKKFEERYFKHEKYIEGVIQKLKSFLENEKLLNFTIKSSLEKHIEKSSISIGYENILIKKKELEFIVNEWDTKSKTEKIKLFRGRRVIEGDVYIAVEELLNEPNYVEEFNDVSEFYTEIDYHSKFNKINLIISEMEAEIVSNREFIENSKEVPIKITKIKNKKLFSK